MDKLALALLAGLALLAIPASRAADQEQLVELTLSGNRDCSKGAIEQRLNCLNYEIVQLKHRMEGREGRIIPLGR
jgi:hypothetical protein